MKKIIEIFTENWRFSFIITALLLAIGGISLPLLQKEILPPVNFARITIQTIYPGASPEEVQDKVTTVIEDELRGISDIKDVRSVSQNNRSEINIRIDIDSNNSENVINNIQRAVQRASSKLPSEVLEAPVIIEQKASELPVLEAAIIGPNKNRERDKIAERLEEIINDIPGVAQVRFTGYSERQLQIMLSREKLAFHQVGLVEVTRAISSHMQNIPAGYIEGDGSKKLVRVMGKVSTPREISDIIIRTNDAGNAIKTGDVAKVLDSGKKQDVITRIDGKEALLLTVTKEENIDAISVLKKIKYEIEKFKKTIPAGYDLQIYNDAGINISNRLEIVTFNALAGFIVVVLVLFVFLPGRIGILSALSLPISTLGTIALMIYLGANFNVITMVALVICLGNLVDNSVVVSEYYVRLREDGMESKQAAIKSAHQFWVPFTASTITILAAFLPMVFTKGVLGQFIKWIPIIVSIALVLSLIEALTLLPARLQFFSLSKKKENSQKKSRLNDLEKKFGELINFSIKRRSITYMALTGLIFLAIAVTVLFNRFELFPAEGVENYTARFSAAAGTPVEKTDIIGRELNDRIYSVLGKDTIKSIITRSGQQQFGIGDSQAKQGEHVGLLIVNIFPDKAAILNSKDVIMKLKKIEKPDGCASLSFSNIQNGPPVGKALTVTFKSSNNDSLAKAVKTFTEKVGKIDGIQNLETDEEATGREYRVIINEKVAGMAQINVDTIGRQLRTALEGVPVAKINKDGKDFDLIVKFDDSDKSSLAKLKSIDILSPRELMVPLKNISSFTEENSPKIIKKYNFRTAVTITADVDPAKITSAIANFNSREVFREIKKTIPDVDAVFGGEEETTRESLISLGIALLLAVVGIFATLVFTFKSFSKPILILSTIPLGLVGVMFAFAITRTPLSFMAFVGVVGLAGVVINAAIVLVDYIEELRIRYPSWNLADILSKASSDRLRAVMATGITTVIGLLPTALGLGGYDSILVPLTLALSWGMIIGTLLTLVWIPSGYMMLEKKNSAISVITENISLEKKTEPARKKNKK